MNTTFPRLTSRPCHNCGSYLILVSEKTEQEEGQYSPITTSMYKCSNAACQKEADRQTRKRLKLQKEQDLARKKRMENAKASRKKWANERKKSA